MNEAQIKRDWELVAGLTAKEREAMQNLRYCKFKLLNETAVRTWDNYVYWQNCRQTMRRARIARKQILGK